MASPPMNPGSFASFTPSAIPAPAYQAPPPLQPVQPAAPLQPAMAAAPRPPPGWGGTGTGLMQPSVAPKPAWGAAQAASADWGDFDPLK